MTRSGGLRKASDEQWKSRWRRIVQPPTKPLGGTASPRYLAAIPQTSTCAMGPRRSSLCIRTTPALPPGQARCPACRIGPTHWQEPPDVVPTARTETRPGSVPAAGIVEDIDDDLSGDVGVVDGAHEPLRPGGGHRGENRHEVLRRDRRETSGATLDACQEKPGPGPNTTHVPVNFVCRAGLPARHVAQRLLRAAGYHARPAVHGDGPPKRVVRER